MYTICIIVHLIETDCMWRLNTTIIQCWYVYWSLIWSFPIELWLQILCRLYIAHNLLVNRTVFSGKLRINRNDTSRVLSENWFIKDIPGRKDIFYEIKWQGSSRLSCSILQIESEYSRGYIIHIKIYFFYSFKFKSMVF